MTHIITPFCPTGVSVAVGQNNVKTCDNMPLHTHSCFVCCSQNGVLWFIPCAAIVFFYLTYAAVYFLGVIAACPISLPERWVPITQLRVQNSSFLICIESVNHYRSISILHFCLCSILQNLADNIPKRGLSRLCSQTAPT